jgi:DNA-binding IclR family transcriptional regulator
VTRVSTSTAGPDPKRNGMQLITRAADVLTALEHAPEGLGVTELALAVGLPKSTAHRVAGALEEEGFVATDPNGKLRLGRRLAQLGAAARGALREHLRPYLVRLAREVDETVDLSVLDGSEVRFIDQVPSTRRLRAVSAVGLSFPLYCTANGKAILAAMPPEQLAAVLPPNFTALTPATIRSRSALWPELDEIRVSGVAYDREEHSEGITAVGAVVHDAYGIAGAISVPVPTQRFAKHEKILVPHLLAVCEEASRSLGA